MALVTGASRGIGRAAARVLAEEGARIAIGFRNNKDGALETKAACPGAEIVHIDIADAESVAAAFDEVERSIGRVEILVNNAGVRRDGLLMRMREDEWAEVIEVDLTGVFRCTKRALPGMLAGRWGRVITIGSIAGVVGNAGQTNYAAAKAGLIGFTKSLAREVARKGVTANVIAPGLVDTALTADVSESARAALLDRVPMGRPGDADEVAEAVRFCARASYLTGQVIAVDGGLS